MEDILLTVFERMSVYDALRFARLCRCSARACRCLVRRASERVPDAWSFCPEVRLAYWQRTVFLLRRTPSHAIFHRNDTMTLHVVLPFQPSRPPTILHIPDVCELYYDASGRIWFAHYANTGCGYATPAALPSRARSKATEHDALMFHVSKRCCVLWLNGLQIMSKANAISFSSPSYFSIGCDINGRHRTSDLRVVRMVVEETISGASVAYHRDLCRGRKKSSGAP